MIEARRLGQQLVAATGARQDETLQALVKSKGSAYTQALVDAIPKLDAKGRNQARDALAERLSRMTAETLRGYLQEGNPELRRAAAWACVLKEAKERIPELIPLLADRDAAVVETVHAALKHMTGTDQGKSIEAWKSWLEKQQE
jgi:HEAT repeat protein